MSLRIAVTGIGLCTPFGPDRETSWRGLLDGHSAVRWLNPPHWPESTPMAGAAVRWPTIRSRRHPEPLVELATITATESLIDSGWELASLRHKSVGIVFGTSKGGLHSYSRLFQEFRSRNEDRSSSAGDWLDVFPDRAAGAIRQLIGGYGPNLCPVAACATGLAACLRGAELINNGDCEIVLAGSADASLQPALLGSFRRLGVLSHEVTDPRSACRPFDQSRSGFVIGEGAACLVLERFDSALQRGAAIYAEWLGGRMLSDPFSLTQLDPDGQTLRKLLTEMRTQISPTPDYINLHGTGTRSNDLIECQAIRAVFGRAADQFCCSSLKGGLGHLLGAAGSVELAATVLAIRDQIIPPTMNLSNPDPMCDLELTPQIASPRQIEHAWKLSLGFGGHMAGACLKKCDSSAGSRKPVVVVQRDLP